MTECPQVPPEQRDAARPWIIAIYFVWVARAVAIGGLALYVYLTQNADWRIAVIWIAAAWIAERIVERFLVRKLERITNVKADWRWFF